MVVPIPELNAIFTSSSVVAKQIFAEYWSYLVIALGLFFAVTIIGWLAGMIEDFVYNLGSIRDLGKSGKLEEDIKRFEAFNEAKVRFFQRSDVKNLTDQQRAMLFKDYEDALTERRYQYNTTKE